MDLEDEGWVSVPYDGLLEVHVDGDEKIFSRKYVKSPTKVYKHNYFDASQTSQEYVEEEVKEIIKFPILITEPKETSVKHVHGPGPEPEPKPKSDQDPIFQVFSKKENQCVEMKMGSPRLSSQESELSRTEMGMFQYEEKKDDHMMNCSPPKMIKKEVVACKESNNEGFMNLWKWGLNGIGGVCSLGMTAATICIIIFVNERRNKQQNKLTFQSYSDNKRINQVVQKANEAMSAVRGVPLVNAQITHGGHYESL